MRRLGWQLPQLDTLEQMAVFFSKQARDSSQPPVLIWLVELSGVDASGMQTCTKLFQRGLIADGEMNV